MTEVESGQKHKKRFFGGVSRLQKLSNGQKICLIVEEVTRGVLNY